MQMQEDEMQILPPFNFGLPRNYSNRADGISVYLNEVVLRSLQELQVQRKKNIPIENILVYDERWEDHKQK